jgi:histidine phosphotransferase ChpT
MSTHDIPSASELAALLASRVCHDIAGSAQAMRAALGVLDDPGAADMREDAIALLRSGAIQVGAKLEYARVCFGAAGTRAGEMSLGEMQTLSAAMFADARPDLVWKPAEGVIDKTAARILLNLVWLAVDSLPRGGTVTVEAHASPGGGARLRVSSAGPRLRLDPSYILALRGERPEDGYDGRSVQPYYAGLMARESGGRAEASVSEERVEFTALTGPGQRAAAA